MGDSVSLYQSAATLRSGSWIVACRKPSRASESDGTVAKETSCDINNATIAVLQLQNTFNHLCSGL